MRHFCYVIVRLEATKCMTKVLAQTSTQREATKWDENTLQRLMDAGWQPLREVSLGNGQALVLLAADTDKAAVAEN